MIDTLVDFLLKMQGSTSYIKMEHLRDAHSYKIWARNAYVGICVTNDSGFIISRYKVGKNPYLFTEYHWDTGEPFGTVKPLELIEKCPFKLKGDYQDSERKDILKYLDNLEENYPLVIGVNTLQERKVSAIRFGQRLSGKSNWREVEI